MAHERKNTRTIRLIDVYRLPTLHNLPPTLRLGNQDRIRQLSNDIPADVLDYICRHFFPRIDVPGLETPLDELNRVHRTKVARCHAGRT